MSFPEQTGTQARLDFSDDVLVEAQDFILLEVQRIFWLAQGEGARGTEFRVRSCIHLLNPLSNPCELDIIIPRLQPRNPKFRDVKDIAQAHTASRCASLV